MNAKAVTFVLFLLLYAAYTPAEMSVDLAGGTEYNLGDPIKVDGKIKRVDGLKGILTLETLCGSHSFSFYSMPIFLKEDVEFIFDVPKLSAFDPMVGKCVVRAEYRSFTGTVIEEKESSQFIVRSDLKIDVVIGNKELEPESIFEAEGTVKRPSGSTVDGENIMIDVFDTEFFVPVREGVFSFKTKIPSFVEAGDEAVLFFMKDSAGNFGDILEEIHIKGVPSHISILAAGDGFLPNEDFSAKITLLDHTKEKIEGKIKVKLIDPSGKVLSDEEVDSAKMFRYSFSKMALPGQYKLKAEFDDVSSSHTLVVKESSSLLPDLKGDILYVKNDGNTVFKGPITVGIKGPGTDITIKRDGSLEPGDRITIDLSKEVAEGDYDIRLPTGEVLEGMRIHDNRPLSKRLNLGIGSITGGVVGTGSTAVPIMIVLFLIILAAIFIFKRGQAKKDHGNGNWR